ncbi:hypothetical protein ACHAPJ_011900 [Fusarium lateritium]
MEDDLEIPRFVVDLSQPPETRYAHIIPHFKESVDSCDLPSLFHELLKELAGPYLGKVLAAVARPLLRRVHSKEESRELKGISKAIKIPMHILVAFNVLLDLLLGCTSGGVRSLGSVTSPKQDTRMLHFRTLDWGMDKLRQIVVELDFVRSSGGPVVATTITYLGYVGVLTGVRKGLSISLNFRPYHARETSRQHFSFRWHQAMVVLGCRQSISSALRKVLLGEARGPDHQSHESQESINVEPESQDASDDYVQQVLKNLSKSDSTSAYIILCQPERVYIVEKDHRRALIHESDTFLTACNHDFKDENDPSRLQEAATEIAEGDDAIGMADLVGFSLDRKNHLENLWKKRVRACRRRYKQRVDVVTPPDVIGFLKDEEISNPETHYAVVMDPKEGKVIWRRLYEAVGDESSSWTTEVA